MLRGWGYFRICAQGLCVLFVVPAVAAAAARRFQLLLHGRRHREQLRQSMRKSMDKREEKKSNPGRKTKK